jgi:hypothetical protein
MLFDAALAALVAGPLGTRWLRTPFPAELDDRLRRDLGLPPRATPLPWPMTAIAPR